MPNAYSRFELKGNPIPGNVFFSEVVNLGVVDPDVVVAVVAVVEVVLLVVVVAVVLVVGLLVEVELSPLTSDLISPPLMYLSHWAPTAPGWQKHCPLKMSQVALYDPSVLQLQSLQPSPLLMSQYPSRHVSQFCPTTLALHSHLPE